MRLESQSRGGEACKELHVAEGTHACSITGALVEICARPLSSRDMEIAAYLLLDWVGISLAAQSERAAIGMRAYAAASRQSGRCTALGAGHFGPEAAAFVNGSLGSLLEMDDLHRASVMHAGDVVIPAALAAAQHNKASGQTLLEAIVVGYEVALRIGQVAASGGYTAWYNSATCGVFGAAMAAAHASGVTDQQKRDALGQAGMQAAGVWQCRLEDTDSKAVVASHAARAGVTSALLGCAGVKGAAEILEGPLGFMKTFYPTANANEIAAKKSDPWKIHEVSFKPWPACRHVHPAVGLMLKLRHLVDADQVENITVSTYKAALEFCDCPSPRTAHEARFSLQHCIATALVAGDLTLDDAKIGALEEPERAMVRAKVRLQEDARFSSVFPRRMGAELTVTERSGKVHRLRSGIAVGDPEEPLTPEEIQKKFKANCQAKLIPDDISDPLLKGILNLHDASTLVLLSAAFDAVPVPLNPNPQEVAQ